jgi:hypothetical protein
MVPMEDFDLSNPRDEYSQDNEQIRDREHTESQNEKCIVKQEETLVWRKHFNFFTEIYPIVLAYFSAYLFAFGYVPTLVNNNLNYQITQFITRTSLFFGRTIGNYIHVKRVGLFGLFYLYNLFLLFLFTITISLNLTIPIEIINLLFISGYFIAGLSYPIVYRYIYDNYSQDKEWYMGAVGQYTSFFTILGCAIGYPLQIVWRR